MSNFYEDAKTVATGWATITSAGKSTVVPDSTKKANGTNKADTIKVAPIDHATRGIYSNGENDFIDISGNYGILWSKATVKTGTGDDSIRIYADVDGIHPATVDIDSGVGNDLVSIYGGNNGFHGGTTGLTAEERTDVSLNLGDGDDKLFIHGLREKGIDISKVKITGGKGKDLISIYGGSSGIGGWADYGNATVSIDGGSGADTIAVNSIDNYGDVTITAGADDVVSVGSGSADYFFDSTKKVTINGAVFTAKSKNTSAKIITASNSITLNSSWNGTVKLQQGQKLTDAESNVISNVGTYSIIGGKTSVENDNIIYGTNKNDIIHNKTAGITIDAGKGDDTIKNGWTKYNVETVSGGDHVSINGGTGNDYIESYDCCMVTVNGNAGNDSILVHGKNSKNVIVDSSDGSDLIETYDVMGTVNSGDGDDDLYICDSAVTVYAESGNDTISIGHAWGTLGGPVVYSGSGDDAIVNRDYCSHIYGEDGNDYIENYGHSNKIYGGKGNDTIITHGNYYSWVSGEVYGYWNNIDAGEGNDYIISDGGWKDTLYASENSGNDTIEGSFSTLKINSGAFTSAYLDGRDVIIKINNNKMRFINAVSRGFSVIDAQNKKFEFTLTYKKTTYKPDIDGNDDSTLPSGVSYNKAKTALTVKAPFTGELNLANYDSKVVTIDASRDTKFVTIKGNAKNNVIKAGTGGSSLYGQGGNDTLYGGNGVDTFVYSSGQGDEVIVNYTAGKDKIKLTSGTVKSSLISGNDVVLNVDDGSIRIKNVAKKKITVIDSKGEQINSAAFISYSTLTSKELKQLQASSANSLQTLIESADAMDIEDLTFEDCNSDPKLYKKAQKWTKFTKLLAKVIKQSNSKSKIDLPFSILTDFNDILVSFETVNDEKTDDIKKMNASLAIYSKVLSVSDALVTWAGLNKATCAPPLAFFSSAIGFASNVIAPNGDLTDEHRQELEKSFINMSGEVIKFFIKEVGGRQIANAVETAAKASYNQILSGLSYEVSQEIASAIGKTMETKLNSVLSPFGPVNAGIAAVTGVVLGIDQYNASKSQYSQDKIPTATRDALIDAAATGIYEAIHKYTFGGDDGAVQLGIWIGSRITGNDYFEVSDYADNWVDLLARDMKYRFFCEYSGTNKGDVMSSAKDKELIYGGNGRDSIANNHSNVTIYGGADDDKVSSATGTHNNCINLGLGNDSVSMHDYNSTLYGGAGKDTIMITGIDSAHIHDNKIFAEGGNDSIKATYTDKSTINGGVGNDYILLRSCNNNTITGGTGDDYIELKNSKNNVIVYGNGQGDDVVVGYTSSDTIEISKGEYTTTKSGQDVIITVGEGSITLDNAEGKTLNIHKRNDQNIPNVILSNNDKSPFIADDRVVTIDASKRTKSIKIVGNSKDNKIMGTSKNDTLLGGAGKDSLVGNGGNDSIVGDDGNDTLLGGAGDDVLIGGKGKDVFVYARNNGKDIITDYTAGQDKIKLNAVKIQKTTYSGNDVVFNITNGDSITVKNGKGKEITIIDSNGKTSTKTYGKATSANIAELWFTADDINLSTYSAQIDSIIRNELSDYSLGNVDTAKDLTALTPTGSLTSGLTFSEK